MNLRVNAVSFLTSFARRAALDGVTCPAVYRQHSRGSLGCSGQHRVDLGSNLGSETGCPGAFHVFFCHSLQADYKEQHF